MKTGIYCLLFFFFTSLSFLAISQQGPELSDLLQKSKPDTNHVDLLLRTAGKYYFTKPDSCYLFTSQALRLSEELNFTRGKVTALNMSGEALRIMGEYPLALEMQMKALEIHIKTNNKKDEAGTVGFIGFIYMELNEFRKALHYLFQGIDIVKKHRIVEGNMAGPIFGPLIQSNIGNSYEKLNMLDSALYFQNIALSAAANNPVKNLKALIQTRLGNIYVRLGNPEQALQHFHNSISIASEIGDRVNKAKAQGRLSDLYFTLNKKDSSLYYARQSLTNARDASQKLNMLDAVNLLARIFRDVNKDSVIFYQDMATALNDSLFGSGKYRQLQLLTLEDQRKQQEILQQAARNKNRMKILGLIVLLGSFLVIALILFRSVRQKQKTNSILQQQKNEIEKNLAILKATQALLIQSEKMASLGELTAGIAHEIQNPLNFVNNFSEINTEMLTELKEEITNGKPDAVNTIINDLVENEKKINHHGKRADSIVKGMLLHSRGSTGVKQLTDINNLIDEYIRLAYHGLKAKDKTFNALIMTDYDETIKGINIVPQEIGRVILNTITNAFHSVSQKSRTQLNGYEPTVFVTSKKNNGKVQINIKDNGLGIPDKLIDKIFQPFFTTKPAGQGTGLGLSLSYDIVKAHNGEMKVESKEGEGAEFTILLPIEV